MAAPTSPSGDFSLVTTSNTVKLTYNGQTRKTRGISFAAAGDLKINNSLGTGIVIPSGALAAGIIHPIETDLIYATGTTATGIVAYF